MNRINARSSYEFAWNGVPFVVCREKQHRGSFFNSVCKYASHSFNVLNKSGYPSVARMASDISVHEIVGTLLQSIGNPSITVYLKGPADVAFWKEHW